MNRIQLAHTLITLALIWLYINCRWNGTATEVFETDCALTQSILTAFADRDSHKINDIVETISTPSVFPELLARHCVDLLEREEMMYAYHPKQVDDDDPIEPVPQSPQSPNQINEPEKECQSKDEEVDHELEVFGEVKAPDSLQSVLAQYFDVSQLHSQFFFHAMRMRNRINCAWRDDGSWFPWRGYDRYDISGCEVDTPECLIWQHPRLNNSMHSTKNVWRKCCVEHYRLKSLLKWTLERIDKYNISAWFAMGTLLALVRHNGVLIPWDTDIDLYVESDQEERLTQAFPNLPPREHWFGHDPRGRAVYWVYYHDIPKSGDAHVELWMWRKGQSKDPTVFNNMIYPLKRCYMFGIRGWCPRDTPGMLREWYGPDWGQYKFTRGQTTKMLTDAVSDHDRYKLVQEYQMGHHKSKPTHKH